MRILLNNNVPKLLTSNLPDHQADTTFQRDWHTLTNGELLDQAESDGYQLLITADQRIPYQQNLSRRSIAVLIITSNERQAPSRQLLRRLVRRRPCSKTGGRFSSSKGPEVIQPRSVDSG